MGSNLGEQTNNLTLNSGEITNVPDFLYNTFHYKHDMIGYVVLILFAFVAAFWVAGWAAFRYLNFNVRPLSSRVWCQTCWHSWKALLRTPHTCIHACPCRHLGVHSLAHHADAQRPGSATGKVEAQHLWLNSLVCMQVR